MTKIEMRDTIDMAREAGIRCTCSGSMGCLKAFEALVRADERALAAPVQEPSYWLGYGLQAHTEKPFEGATPLYTTPPAAQRQWVGLTEDEVSQIIGEHIGFNSCWGPEEDFAKAIEAKLKEKNT